jgi:Transcriptional regulator, AbiEi antitoxin
VVRHQSATPDRKLAELAARTHGVVTRGQLLREGITPSEIRQRLAAGTLFREYPGVYRVGHRAPSLEARYRAATLAGGEGALLRGPAAAHLLGLLRGAPPPPEVLTPKRRRVAGLRTHETRRLDPRDRTVWRGIPVTSVPRTLVDLAATLPEDELARAFHEAGIRHHTTPEHVEEVLARRPSSPGAAKLRRVVRGDVRVTLSRLESRFLALLTEHGLELPETNRPAGGRRVDARWPEQRLTVELDSYRYHRSRHAWEQDRHREREARARGDEFRRYTYGDVLEDARPLLAELGGLLSKAPGSSSRRDTPSLR